VSQSFPILVESDANAIGTGFWNGSLPYVIFIVFIIFLIFFTKKYIIETKGKSLEQLEGIWAEKYGKIES
jgi:SP family xylose:H+ symportor-like MFS transporter